MIDDAKDDEEEYLSLLAGRVCDTANTGWQTTNSGWVTKHDGKFVLHTEW